MRNNTNKKQPITLPKSEIHEETINEKHVVKYLGDYFNCKGNNKDLISKRIGSSVTAITDIMGFCFEVSLGNFEIHILLQHYDLPQVPPSTQMHCAMTDQLRNDMTRVPDQEAKKKV